MYATLNMYRLLLYRKMLADPIMENVQQIQQQLQNLDSNIDLKLENLYADLIYQLVQQAESQRIRGKLWKNYIAHLLIADENAFSLACEQNDSIGQDLRALAAHDLALLQQLYNFDWEPLCERLGYGLTLVNNEPASADDSDQYAAMRSQIDKLFMKDLPLEDKVLTLAAFYRENGCGNPVRYPAFRWDNALIGIPSPDPICFDDLVGYTHQKEILISNTRSFVLGKKANNILLYGEKGTGKSSSVKALLNLFAPQGLRMIEFSKTQLADFPRVIRAIRDRRHRYVIFIDDLSFEDFEVDYKYLKANLEGSLETKADNVLVYVTSNRRHLIKENWSDRERNDEEVHVADTQQEKLSFADRFGITIRYYSPNQEQYLDIVTELALKSGLDMPLEELRRKAIQWELNYNGRSGRTAQQFITYLISQQ